MAPADAAARTRDAQRSREAILDAAERLFAQRGFDATSLSDIGAEAGLSRGTPSYFFGSKEQLYVAVLARGFEAREAATRAAFAPLVHWCEADRPTGSLAKVLGEAVDGYLAFLLGRPAFVRLVEWEELAGGSRLAATPRESRAIEDALRALRDVAPSRGLRRFDLDEAVLLLVSLTFSPLTQRSTFLVRLGWDLEDAAVRRRLVELVVRQLLTLVER